MARQRHELDPGFSGDLTDHPSPMYEVTDNYGQPIPQPDEKEGISDGR